MISHLFETVLKPDVHGQSSRRSRVVGEECWQGKKTTKGLL